MAWLQCGVIHFRRTSQAAGSWTLTTNRERARQTAHGHIASDWGEMRAKDIEVVKTLIKRPVAFHWALAMMCESVHAGLMLSQAIYWSELTEDPEGWFYKTRTDWFKELCLGRYEQETAREILRERGFVAEELRGNPAKMHYQVHIEAVYDGLLKVAGKQPSAYKANAR